VTDSGYNIALASKEALPVPQGFTVRAELLTRAGDACLLPGGRPAHAIFESVPLEDVTPFVVFRVTSPDGMLRGTVVRAQLIGDPPGRLDEVLARQVDTPEKFLRFLALLLGLGDATALINQSPHGGQSSGFGFRAGANAGVFELLLRALVEQPRALDDLERLVNRLQATDAGSKVLPEGFFELWEKVLGAHRMRAKGDSR